MIDIGTHGFACWQRARAVRQGFRYLMRGAPASRKRARSSGRFSTPISAVNLLLYGSLLIVASFAAASLAHAEASPPRPQPALGPRWVFTEFQQATEALARRDCRGAWEAIWPLAKSGRAEARYLLWAFTVSTVAPPGWASIPEEADLRHRLTIAAYAAAVPQGPMPWHGAPDHRWARNEIPLMISKLKQSANTEQVASCYRRGSSFNECLDHAVSRGVVQSFDAYAAEIDAMVSSGSAKASCKSRPW